MTTFLIVIFWTGVVMILYTYVGYGIIITLLSRFHRHRHPQPPLASREHEFPEVTFVVAAYNEEAFIEEKICNTFGLDYPKDKLTIFVVTDGSTDHTPELVKKFHAVKLFHEPARKGKVHAVNRIIPHVKTPVVVFSDANTLLNTNALRNLVRHFADPGIGGVAGEKRILNTGKENAPGSGEGLYWKYESYLKRKDSEVYSVVGAAGELFAVRTRLYHPPDETTIIEDFVLSLEIAAQGYRFVYEPEAQALETASISVDEEWKRKVRICAGGFQAMARLKHLLNPARYGILSFQYISHRVLRWTAAPLFLPLILSTNVWLAWQFSGFYGFCIIAQCFFYLAAIVGYLFRNRAVSIKGFFVAYYFVVMNLAVYAGLARYLSGKQSVIWEKAQRATIQAESLKS